MKNKLSNYLSIGRLTTRDFMVKFQFIAELNITFRHYIFPLWKFTCVIVKGFDTSVIGFLNFHLVIHNHTYYSITRELTHEAIL